MRLSTIFARKRRRGAAIKPVQSAAFVDPFDLLHYELTPTHRRKLTAVVEHTSTYRCATAVLSTADDQLMVSTAYMLKQVLSHAEHALQLAEYAPEKALNTLIMVVTPSIEVANFFLTDFRRRVAAPKLKQHTGYEFQRVSRETVALVRANSTVMITAVDALSAARLVARRKPDSVLVLSSDRLLFETTRGGQLLRTLIQPLTHNLRDTTSVCLFSALPPLMKMRPPPTKKAFERESSGQLSPRLLAEMSEDTADDAQDVLL